MEDPSDVVMRLRVRLGLVKAPTLPMEAAGGAVGVGGRRGEGSMVGG